jgi:hypothetical protein
VRRVREAIDRIERHPLGDVLGVAMNQSDQPE